ncbi:hypothetical protein T07_14733 [Trichinella nelsoni]|uniref:Uncharacterized protein n=1 Tax=Trichinella nelsoni TaxID=6336 RepID=A0A0V0RRF1_9BILA|nr:hypothetical protein T07_14733 [Trichinella nelsoni]
MLFSICSIYNKPEQNFPTGANCFQETSCAAVYGNTSTSDIQTENQASLDKVSFTYNFTL